MYSEQHLSPSGHSVAPDTISEESLAFSVRTESVGSNQTTATTRSTREPDQAMKKRLSFQKNRISL